MSKYKAVKVKTAEGTFDSKREYHRWNELKLLRKAGIIQNLERQVPFILIPKSKYGREIKYIADFVYKENGKPVVEDSKGVRTDVYKLKKRLMAEKYGIRIVET